jgi:putative spermidine/putrescine transport system ATP-binding protein
MLSIRGITKRFGDVVAVDATDLDVAQGELVCLLGPSGCGKSTLLRMVAGLAEADGGTVSIAGQDVTREPANRRPTAMVFQSHALWTHMTVARNVAFGLRVRRLPRAEIERKVAAALDLVGLAGYERRLPSELSGGQAQRVALARCLVVEPRVLLMDEPFSALDAHLRAHMREEVKALQHRLGLTILFVTHDQEEAMEIADRIAVMNAGRLQQVGRPGELYAAPRTEFVAAFIGIMNMRPVTVTRGRVDWLGTVFDTRLADGPATAGVRPEDIAIVPTGGVAVRVERVIDFGAVRRLTLAAPDGAVVRLQTAAGPDLGHVEPAAGAVLRIAPRRVALYRDGDLADTLVPDAAEIAA